MSGAVDTSGLGSVGFGLPDVNYDSFFSGSDGGGGGLGGADFSGVGLGGVGFGLPDVNYDSFFTRSDGGGGDWSKVATVASKGLDVFGGLLGSAGRSSSSSQTPPVDGRPAQGWSQPQGGDIPPGGASQGEIPPGGERPGDPDAGGLGGFAGFGGPRWPQGLDLADLYDIGRGFRLDPPTAFSFAGKVWALGQQGLDVGQAIDRVLAEEGAQGAPFAPSAAYLYRVASRILDNREPLQVWSDVGGLLADKGTFGGASVGLPPVSVPTGRGFVPSLTVEVGLDGSVKAWAAQRDPYAGL